jgi:class 3 adenylate cyclase
VNLAARMEQAAPAGGICVSAETWRALERFCRGRSQGLIPVKGKGELEVFCVEEIYDRPRPKAP